MKNIEDVWRKLYHEEKENNLNNHIYNDVSVFDMFSFRKEYAYYSLVLLALHKMENSGGMKELSRIAKYRNGNTDSSRWLNTKSKNGEVDNIDFIFITNPNDKVKKDIIEIFDSAESILRKVSKATKKSGFEKILELLDNRMYKKITNNIKGSMRSSYLK